MTTTRANREKFLLLTGATGLVGQYLLRDLLLAGQPVAVLVRGKGKKSADRRIEDILGHWERELGRSLPAPVVLAGDVSSDDLGLSPADRAWIKGHCRGVLHNAASLTFIGKSRDDEPWKSNFTGTANVLEFCRATGLRELHYMSTAYVCGKRTGTIYESELAVGQQFRNDYEECKLEAERLVRQADWLDRLTVYRPAVITGDSRTGYTATYHGVYSYIQFIWLVVQLLTRDPDGRLYYPLRLTITGGERRNLVPVDWVAGVTSHIVRHPQLHGRTYHLTPLRPATAGELHEAFAEYFRFYGTSFAGPTPLRAEEMNEYEKMFYSYVARYEEYLTTEPEFDSRNTQAAAPHLPCPHLDAACLHRLIDFAVHDRFGKRRAADRKIA